MKILTILGEKDHFIKVIKNIIIKSCWSIN